MNFSSSLVKFSRTTISIFRRPLSFITDKIQFIHDTLTKVSIPKRDKSAWREWKLKWNPGTTLQRIIRSIFTWTSREEPEAEIGKRRRDAKASLVCEISGWTSDSIPTRFCEQKYYLERDFIVMEWIKAPQKRPFLFKLTNRTRQRFTSSPRPPTTRHVSKWNRFSVAKMFYCSRFTINKQSWAKSPSFALEIDHKVYWLCGYESSFGLSCKGFE